MLMSRARSAKAIFVYCPSDRIFRARVAVPNRKSRVRREDPAVRGSDNLKAVGALASALTADRVIEC